MHPSHVINKESVKNYVGKHLIASSSTTKGTKRIIARITYNKVRFVVTQGDKEMEDYPSLDKAIDHYNKL